MRRTRHRAAPGLHLLALLLAPVLIWHACDATPARADAADPFPCPASLRPAVEFWKDVFGSYGWEQIVYFDERDVSRVYEIHRLPFPDGSRARERLRESARDRYKEQLEHDLKALAGPGVDYDALTGRQRRLFSIWDEVRDPGVYREAADNVRSQRGIQESFQVGVARSARYVGDFRAILRQEGVPEDLAYLPHVESVFQWNARSQAGAVGMWQFMSDAGRRYRLHIDEAVDERLDPHAAARAAALFLKDAYAELGSWPLAVTSYNQGVGSMAVAVDKVGSTDIERVIRGYRGPRFGFAGRNFYVEFLAARELGGEMLARPGDLVLQEPVTFDTFTLPGYVKAKTLAGALALDDESLLALNPAARPAVRSGEEWLPLGYEVRIPTGLGAEAPSLFAGIPERDRPLTKPVQTYKVRSGDSLSGIAARFGTTVRSLQNLNGITNPNRLRAGQILRIPH